MIDPTGAVVPPIHPSTTFARNEAYELVGTHVYSRYGSPTVDLAERVLAELDGGAGSLLFASGMAAIAAFTSSIDPGGHVVAPSVMYHGARNHLERLAADGRIDLELVDADQPGALQGAIVAGRTALVWIESALNPTWTVLDIPAIARAAHAAGALLAVDATVTPPCTLRALDHGADIVFHSASKYLNGHSDLTAGVLTTASHDTRWDEVRATRDRTGGVLGAFEAWLLLRGLRTLWIRYAAASANAAAIADALAGHPAVTTVLYPGSRTHPTHPIAADLWNGGYGGMLSLIVAGGAERARTMASRTEIFCPATSLGGVESTIEHRASVEGPGSPVPPGLVRLSVGIEPADELIADLHRALGT